MMEITEKLVKSVMEGNVINYEDGSPLDKRDMEDLEIEILEYLDDLYHNHPKKVFIQDIIYDKYKEIVEEVYPDNPYFKKVGATISGEKVKLPFVLGSLERVRLEDVEKWFNKYKGPWLATEKLDGVSIMVQYVNGEVTFATTRGDGIYGKNITDKAKIFCPKIKYNGSIFFRGEAMLVDDPTKLGFKNRRNGCAGILNRDDLGDCKKLTAFFYEIIKGGSLEIARSQKSQHRFLEDIFHWNVPNSLFMEEFDIQALKDFYIKSKTEAYETDGIVITVDDYIRENVRYPKKKVKFKMPGEKVETVVEGIEWNVTRTKKVVPVILVRPVTISGSTIGRTTGWNAKFINDHKLSKGRKVIIEKAGDVIPYVTICDFTNNPDFNIIDSCPSCGDYLSWEGVDLVCDNEDCGGSEYKSVEYFLTTMGAEYITEKTLKKLGANTIESLYDMDEYFISSIDGFAMKKANLIVNELQKILNGVRPEKLISSFGISGIGETVSKSIVNSLGDKTGEEVMEEIMNLTPDKLESIDGIGEVLAKNFSENIKKFDSVVKFLVNKGMKYKSCDSTLRGKIFTLTGKCDIMGRETLKEKITDKGGTVKGISKKTSFLVTSDPDSNSGKAKKAREYGTKIISYDELIEMLE